MYKGSDLIIDFLSKNKNSSMEKIATATKLHIDSVRRAVEWLRDNGYVNANIEAQQKQAKRRKQ